MNAFAQKTCVDAMRKGGSMKFLCKEDESHNRFSTPSVIVENPQSWTKIVDKEGVMLNYNPHIQTIYYRCEICGRAYTRFQKGSKLYFHVGQLALRLFGSEKAFHIFDLEAKDG